MKWIFRIILAVIILVIVGVFGLKMYLEKYFDKDIIVKAVEDNTNSRFELGDVNIGLFSFTPSLSMSDIKLGKRDNYAEEKIHIDKRPALENEIVSVENIELKANLLPLIDKRFELNKFIIKRPVVRLSLGKKGRDNLSPLFKSQQPVSLKEEITTEDGEPEEFEEIEETETKTEILEETEENAPAFSAGDIPVAAEMNQIGIENGEVDVFFENTQQRFLISDFFMVIDKIDIDPKRLASHNKASVTFNTNLSIFNKEKSEQAKLSLNSNAEVRPLDPKTGKIEPEAVYSVTLGKGSFIQALVALEKVKSTLNTLEKIGLDLSLLSEKAVLNKDAETAVRYKEGKVSFEEDLKVLTNDYDIAIEKLSWFNVLNNQHLFKGDITVSEAESEKLLAQVDKFIDNSTKDIDLKGFEIDKKEIRNELLAGAVKDERVYIAFTSKGDISDPKVKLSYTPASLTALIKKKAGAAFDQKVEEVKEKVKEEIDKAKEEAQAKIDEEKAKAEEEAKKKAEELLDENKDKIKIPGF